MELINDYEIQKNIGGGGFSKIYKAFDKKNKRFCALKIIDTKLIDKSNEKDYLLNMIMHEIKIMKLCKSANFVEIYDFFQTKDSFVIVMELCDTDLENYIKDYKNKNEYIKISIIQQLFKDLNNAIEILYKNHVIHRDIKPSNIFLKIENGKIIPKLGDFGISIISNKNYEINYNKIGTLNYIAPEVMKGSFYNYKIDLYSLGCVLYYALFLDEYYIDLIMGDSFKIEELLKGQKFHNLKNLLTDLLKESPGKRISMEDYLDHPFFKENPENLAFLSVGMSDNEYKKKYLENKNKESIKVKIINDLAKNMSNIMDISNSQIEKNNKTSNILYYDENIDKYLEEIHEDADCFERNTPGAFILCSNIFSLNLIMEDINFHYSKKDKRVLFNLIITGSKYEKVMEYLIKNRYDHLIKNICIYCIHVDNYLHLKKNNNKIKGVYNTCEDIVKFIKDISSEEFIQYPITKIISYNDYKNKYYERHEKISEFYGDLTKETYKEYSQKLLKYINSKKEKDFKIAKKELIEGFKTFDIDQDLNNLNKIIKEYSKDTIYPMINNNLRNFDDEVYEIISYYTARLMYALNKRTKELNSYFTKNNIVYRGESVNFVKILPYERLKGKIVVLSAFTSTSKDFSVAANDFAHREISKKIFNENRKFSVIYYIQNIQKKNCFPCGIDIQEISEYDNEKEILFQPFSFYLVKNVIFNFNKYTVDIYLELIPKEEIFEEKIRFGKKIVYDKTKNLMVIEGEQNEKIKEKDSLANDVNEKKINKKTKNECIIY